MFGRLHDCGNHVSISLNNRSCPQWQITFAGQNGIDVELGGAEDDPIGPSFIPGYPILSEQVGDSSTEAMNIGSLTFNMTEDWGPTGISVSNGNDRTGPKRNPHRVPNPTTPQSLELFERRVWRRRSSPEPTTIFQREAYEYSSVHNLLDSQTHKRFVGKTSHPLVSDH